ncbi:carbonic anhydrase [Actinokineospora alba]|uniref:carbonic anhydrase n=2 Tax=Actinokineospora alba TaxID=504798 RepID=A0A1H0QUG7_9PSEU|nr:carbonic anhydrase [Actinokineospora alba]SDI32777.1 carbonic anhydrase [Actinokineospora alba]SDP20953.1 carbonic anhydrase [Actinokineospora alba]
MVTATGGAAHSREPTQSPIDVTFDAIRFDPAQPKLSVSYGRTDVELEYVRKDLSSPTGCATRHAEETEEAAVEPGSGHVTLAGVRYDLVQFHFHTPAEHRVGGRADPLEMHLVHRSADGKLVVIGVPLRPGARSTVDTVLSRLAPECGEPVDVPDIDLATLLPANRLMLGYTGSLTTAPFTEGVRWYLTTPLTVSPATIARFQGMFTSGNARSVQPLNGRNLVLTPRLGG